MYYRQLLILCKDAVPTYAVTDYVYQVVYLKRVLNKIKKANGNTYASLDFLTITGSHSVASVWDQYWGSSINRLKYQPRGDDDCDRRTCFVVSITFDSLINRVKQTTAYIIIILKIIIIIIFKASLASIFINTYIVGGVYHLAYEMYALRVCFSTVFKVYLDFNQ